MITKTTTGVTYPKRPPLPVTSEPKSSPFKTFVAAFLLLIMVCLLAYCGHSNDELLAAKEHSQLTTTP